MAEKWYQRANPFRALNHHRPIDEYGYDPGYRAGPPEDWVDPKEQEWTIIMGRLQADAKRVGIPDEPLAHAKTSVLAAWEDQASPDPDGPPCHSGPAARPLPSLGSPYSAALRCAAFSVPR